MVLTANDDDWDDLIKDMKEMARETIDAVKSYPKNKQEGWTTISSTTTYEGFPDTYIGDLHFDLEKGELFVAVKGKRGKEEKVIIEDINDFKKLATKKLLRR